MRSIIPVTTPPGRKTDRRVAMPGFTTYRPPGGPVEAAAPAAIARSMSVFPSSRPYRKRWGTRDPDRGQLTKRNLKHVNVLQAG